MRKVGVHKFKKQMPKKYFEKNLVLLLFLQLSIIVYSQ